jgi:hypothetical protein
MEQGWVVARPPSLGEERGNAPALYAAKTLLQAAHHEA